MIIDSVFLMMISLCFYFLEIFHINYFRFRQAKFYRLPEDEQDILVKLLSLRANHFLAITMVYIIFLSLCFFYNDIFVLLFLVQTLSFLLSLTLALKLR